MIRISKFQRPNSRWYIRYWLAGRPVDESAKTESESAAEAYRIRREIEIGSGIETMRHAEIGDLTDFYIDAMPPGTSPEHTHEARRVLATFVRLCGRKRRDGSHRLQTQQISPETIDRFIHRRLDTPVFDGSQRDVRGQKIVRKKQLSNVGLKTELRYLSGFFNWCCRQRPRYLRENPIPLSNAGSIKRDAKPHFMITEEEFRRLLAACESPSQYLFILLG